MNELVVCSKGMSTLPEPDNLDEVEFKWGQKGGTGGKNKKVQFYKSFTYDGLDYALYDSVYMYKKDEPAPYIGKLIKIWENADKSKKIKVQWFFRPSEISHYLKDAEVSENELFFASGGGKGLANINPLEAIAGKCNVVCTSTDSRNPQPSAEEIQMADYVFYRIFHVGSFIISDQMDDKVGGLEVKYVFNKKEGATILDGPRVDPNDKDAERNVVSCEETPKLAGKNSTQQLNNVKLDKNSDRKLKEEDRNVSLVPVKQGSLLGKYSYGVHVISNKNTETTGTSGEERSMSGAKNVGCNVSDVKDVFKDIKSPLSQVQVEERVKFVGESCDLDDATSKRAKSNGTDSSLKVEDTSGLQSLTVTLNDAAHLVNGATPFNAKPKPELVNDSSGCIKDVKPGEENSGFLDEKMSKKSFSLSKEAPRSGHAEDAVGCQKSSKLNNDLNALQAKLSKSNSFESIEKSKSVHAKESDGTENDKRSGGSACRERPSTSKPTTTSVSPNETPKSGSNNDLEGSKQAAKLVQSSTTTMKRPLKRSADLCKEKSSTGHENSLENKDKTLASGSSPTGERSLKKAKFDDTIKQSEDNNSNTIKKLKEKNSVDETKNSPKPMPKSPMGEGSMKKAKFDDNIKQSEGNKSVKKLKEKNSVGETKNSPKLATSYDNKAKSRLGEVALKECHNGKDGELSNDNLPNPLTTKSKANGEEVGSRSIEVTRRPLEKREWIKFSWEDKMKTGHDQGRLVLLQNLDPEYTSGEIEDIIWHAFQEKCTARMVQQTAISNPHSGQAFVVFGSREVADRVVQKLNDECLMLPNQRPLVGCRGVLPKSSEKRTTFVGHLAVDKARRQTQREMKEAVSTSHYFQNNTIEYEMAMDWCLLQSKSDRWWERLYQTQRKEIEKLTDNIKSK